MEKRSDSGGVTRLQPDRVGTADAAAVTKCCFTDKALLWFPADGWQREENFRIMIPCHWPFLSLRIRSLRGRYLLWGTSQMQSQTCDNLKNLAFPIEPPANPIRPTLRDGH
jgi:hypothetical protein